MCFFFIQSCEPLGKKKTTKKINNKKNAHHSFMSLVSYLPPLLPPSPHFSSTDRNLTVADSHVLATQINIAFLPI